jgi:hypothetical protein
MNLPKIVRETLDFMADSFTCWKCGNNLVDVILPMSRQEACLTCTADQHVCKMCIFYDGRGTCEEEQAEDVSDRERANFCDYFKPSSKLHSVTSQHNTDNAKAKFAALFGDSVPEQDSTEGALSPAELAEKKLRDLLG